MALRRAEDVAALILLNADWYHAGYLDAVYRADADGRWLYTDLETLIGQVQPGDPLASAQADLITQVLGFTGTQPIQWSMPHWRWAGMWITRSCMLRRDSSPAVAAVLHSMRTIPTPASPARQRQLWPLPGRGLAIGGPPARPSRRGG